VIVKPKAYVVDGPDDLTTMTNPLNKKPLLISIAIIGILVLAAVLVTSSLRAHDAGVVGPGIEISITGSVDHNFNLTQNNSRTMPIVTVTSELICVDGTSLGTHNWTGVRLSDLLDEAGVQASAVKVGFHAPGGYTTDLTLQDAARQDVIVAFEKDGAPLKEKTRLVVPGMWGYKWISGIDQVTLYDYDFKGMWESRGYSDDATIGA
jgi:DMSO/TMAO reductase YedYZ molybdopterin-dependent catalytic subunit